MYEIYELVLFDMEYIIDNLIVFVWIICRQNTHSTTTINSIESFPTSFVAIHLYVPASVLFNESSNKSSWSLASFISTKILETLSL